MNDEKTWEQSAPPNLGEASACAARLVPLSSEVPGFEPGFRTLSELREIAQRFHDLASGQVTTNEETDLRFLANEFDALAARIEAEGATGIKIDVTLPGV